MTGQDRRSVPVYLFTGFLGGGKTRFIHNTLQDPKFYPNGKVLVLVCEEGEAEYCLDDDAADITFLEISDQSGLSPDNLHQYNERYHPAMVLCEYNGMWMIEPFISALPSEWKLRQTFFFADSGTILLYNANMRQLTYDKLRFCNVSIFNRFTPELDMQVYHKLVRAASLHTEIFYETTTGKTIRDTIEDVLPFDLSTDVIEIKDEDYAVWYRDLLESPAEYEGKNVLFTGYVEREEAAENTFLIGRPLMFCCMEDLQFAGISCKVSDCEVRAVQPDQWITVLGRIELLASDHRQPALKVLELHPAKEPRQVIATFF